jgi:hypothetical protein
MTGDALCLHDSAIYFVRARWVDTWCLELVTELSKEALEAKHQLSHCSNITFEHPGALDHG